MTTKRTGANLRLVTRVFCALGGSVENRRRTGEDTYRHPEMLKPLQINSRRKDAPRVLSQAVHRLQHRKEIKPA